MEILGKKITYQLIKENIGMLVLIPTILGGLWQGIELICVGTAYLRFFSLSQLIPDGIIILILSVLTLLVTSSITRGWWKSLEDHIAVEKNENDETASSANQKEKIFLTKTKPWYVGRDAYILLALIIILPSAILIITWPEVSHFFKSNRPIPFIGFIAIIWFILIIIRMLTMAISVILDLRKKAINIGSKKVRNFLSFVYLIACLFTLALAVFFMGAFHRSFAIPDNLKNLEYLSSKIKISEPEIKTFKVLYFNDKYIFVRLFDNKSKELIKVLKFEDLINEDKITPSKH